MMKKIVLVMMLFTFSRSTCRNNTECKGKPLPDCMCTMEYNPVCGCDGKEYGNACTARCEGVKEWKNGPCN